MLRFSKECNEVIELSRIIASNLGHSFIGTEHLLLALLGRKESGELIYSKTNSSYNIDYRKVMDQVVDRHGRGEKGTLNGNNFTRNFKSVIEKSYIRAFSNKSNEIDVSDVICSLLHTPDTVAWSILENCKKGSESPMITTVKKMNLETINSMRKETPILNTFSKDITLLAVEDKLDPVIGREAEIERIMQILLRKNKNNPCLVGNAGVGKSAIVEGLATRIVSGTVPKALRKMRIVAVDIASLLAGAKYRGDFEERLKSVFDEVKKCKNVIIMIDEIHNIVNTGAGEGTLDAANILKPELARGDVSIIGATTVEEYVKTIEKDSALDRRFQRILVDEPSPEATLKILYGIKSKYEEYHEITIDDAAIKEALDIAVRHIHNKYLPDKAIDLIDESAARVKLEQKGFLTASDVKKVFEQQEKRILTVGKFSDIKENLNSRIIGQNKAIEKAVNTLLIRRSELNDSHVPVSMFFAGPTGSGKTLTAKLLSEIFYGENSLLKLDMAEYSEQHSVARLIGAPPGYVGYDDGGLLVTELSKNPRRVILFDEIDKAHHDVYKILLNILDDGIIRNSRGKSVSLKSCAIIFTSSIGYENVKQQSGFICGHTGGDNREIYNLLGSEIYGRIDETVFFERANAENAIRLCDKMQEKTKSFCQKHGIDFEMDTDVAEKIVSMSDINTLGYRNLKKNYQKHINNLISYICFENIPKAIKIYLDERGEITSFSDFGKMNLENNELSMYNNQKRAD